ncbi:MAG: hypothetical protein KF763_15335 [Cyclobacteriaceae bacterium]|nr:hypothetical protein [Cyclobacteriaceae bacterium]
MKKVRMILSVLAVVFAVAGAVAMRASTNDVRWFYVNESDQPIGPPMEIAPSDCILTSDVCAREYSKDSAGNYTIPTGTKVDGERL